MEKALHSHTSTISFLKKQGLVIAFIIILIIMSFFYKGLLAKENILMVLTQVAIVGVMACGMTYVIIGGNFDLSIGAIVSFTMVFSLSMHDKVGPLNSVIATLAVGLIMGSVNGYFIGFVKLNSFIVTLGTGMIISALTLIYSNERYVTIENPSESWFPFIGQGCVGDIPFLIMIFIVVAVIFAVVLKKTLLGRYIFAVGGNIEASKYTGIRTNKVVMMTFLLSGFTAALGGIMQAARLLGTQGNQGKGMEFTVLTAVILGGTSLQGGSGNIIKTVIGVLILGFIDNGLILIGLPYYFQSIVVSIVIIASVWFDNIFNKGE